MEDLPMAPQRRERTKKKKRVGLTADQVERLETIFVQSADTTLKGFLQTVRDAKRDGNPNIKPGENFSSKQLLSFLKSYGDDALEMINPQPGIQRRRGGYGEPWDEDRKERARRGLGPRYPKKESSIWVPSPRMLYQMDIKDLGSYKREEGEEDFIRGDLRYTLGCIDVNSRFAQVQLIPTRSEANLKEAFEKIMDVMGPPERLNADQEFNQQWVHDWADENNVVLFFSNPNEYTNKNAIIEAFWKPWSKIVRKFTIITGGDWTTHLDELIDSYNNRRHFTTHEKPVDVFEGRVPNRQTIVVAQAKGFKVGDFVKIAQKPQPFRKALDRNLSREVYEIEKPGTLRTLSPQEKKERRIPKDGPDADPDGPVSKRRWFLREVLGKDSFGQTTKYSYSEMYLKKVDNPYPDEDDEEDEDDEPVVPKRSLFGARSRVLDGKSDAQISAKRKRTTAAEQSKRAKALTERELEGDVRDTVDARTRSDAKGVAKSTRSSNKK